MRKRKFKIMYPADYDDKNKAGTEFKVGGKDMIVMNNNGILFIFNGETYYPSIRPLTDKLRIYDVVWIDAE